MRRSSRFPVRSLAVLVAVVATVGLLAGCGQASSKPDAAAAQVKAQVAQDKVATAQDSAAQRAAQNRERLVAAIRQRWQERAAASRAARQAVRRSRRSSTVVQVFGYSSIDVCAPVGPKGGSKAERLARRARLLQRKQTLYYLNLSCPSL